MKFWFSQLLSKTHRFISSLCPHSRVNFWFSQSLPKTHRFISCLCLQSTVNFWFISHSRPKTHVSSHLIICFIFILSLFYLGLYGLKREALISLFVFPVSYYIIVLFGLIWFKFLKENHITSSHVPLSLLVHQTF